MELINIRPAKYRNSEVSSRYQPSARDRQTPGGRGGGGGTPSSYGLTVSRKNINQLTLFCLPASTASKY